MRVYDDEIAALTGDVEIPQILDVAAGHIHDLMVNQYGSYSRTMVYDVPVAVSVLTLPCGIKLTAPDCEIEVNDLTAPIGSGFTEEPISKRELLSLSAILTTIHTMMTLNNMDHPSHFTIYQ